MSPSDYDLPWTDSIKMELEGIWPKTAEAIIRLPPLQGDPYHSHEHFGLDGVELLRKSPFRLSEG